MKIPGNPIADNCEKLQGYRCFFNLWCCCSCYTINYSEAFAEACMADEGHLSRAFSFSGNTLSTTFNFYYTYYCLDSDLACSKNISVFKMKVVASTAILFPFETF